MQEVSIRFSLSNLRSLEMRENLLRVLPVSIGHLQLLQRLDLGANELDELVGRLDGGWVGVCMIVVTSSVSLLQPGEIGNLVNLEELYVDANDLEMLPRVIS